MEWRRRDRIVDQENLQPVEVVLGKRGDVLDALAQDRKRVDTITEERKGRREREREEVRNRRKEGDFCTARNEEETLRMKKRRKRNATN